MWGAHYIVYCNGNSQESSFLLCRKLGVLSSWFPGYAVMEKQRPISELRNHTIVIWLGDHIAIVVMVNSGKSRGLLITKMMVLIIPQIKKSIHLPWNRDVFLIFFTFSFQDQFNEAGNWQFDTENDIGGKWKHLYLACGRSQINSLASPVNISQIAVLEQTFGCLELWTVTTTQSRTILG